jgi:hypothetical protein
VKYQNSKKRGIQLSLTIFAEIQMLILDGIAWDGGIDLI